MHILRVTTLLLAFFWLCNNLYAETGTQEFSFDRLVTYHSEWTLSQTVPHELLELDGHQVQIRGFIYQLSQGEWILATTPNLKSCCLGTDSQAGNQIYVSWDSSPETTSSVILAQGRFKIDSKTASSHPYFLENAIIVHQEHSSWIYLVLAAAIIGLGVVFKKKMVP